MPFTATAADSFDPLEHSDQCIIRQLKQTKIKEVKFCNKKDGEIKLILNMKTKNIIYDFTKTQFHKQAI